MNIWLEIFKIFCGFAAYCVFLHIIQLGASDLQGIIHNKMIQTMPGQWLCMFEMAFVVLEI